MASSDDVEMKDRPSDDVASSSSSDEEPSLAITRPRRSTAGARMSALIDAEADDELALLFAEDEDDDEFEIGQRGRGGLAGEDEGDEDVGEEDEAEDVDMSSSSDEDEDKGPNAPQNEELEGEKELQKQARAEAKRKKKKADESLKLTALRKRAMVSSAAARASKSAKKDEESLAEGAVSPQQADLTAAEEAAALAKKRKKSERISWLPTLDDVPTRSSSRRQTMANKEQTHARLKDSEEKRVRLIATMEKAAKRKEKLKAKAMTQADRLEEAKRTERLNSKSLNRWEEMERKRIEEQQERLRALQNRRLEGAVVTYWSGPAKWVDGKLVKVGITEVHEREEPIITKKRKAKDTSNGKGTKASKISQVSSNGPITFVVGAIKTETDTRPSTAQNTMLESEPVSAISASTTFPGSSRPQSQGQLQDTTLRIENSSPAAHVPFDALAKTAGCDFQTAQSQRLSPNNSSSLQTRPELQQPIIISGSPGQGLDQDLPYRPQDGTRASESAPIATPAVTTDQVQQTASVQSSITTAIAKNEVISKPVSAISAAPTSYVDQTGVAPSRLILPSMHAHSVPIHQLPPSGRSQYPIQVPNHNLQSRPTTDTEPFSIEGGPPPPQYNQQPTPMLPDTMDINEPPHVPVIEHTSRESYIFTDIDSLTTAQKAGYAVFLENQNPPEQSTTTARATTSRSRSTKPPKQTKPVVELCPITSKPAKYRDPVTNLAYASALAYKEIHETLNNRYAWSSVLGCFCGPIGVGARGVPERFLAPNTVPKDMDIVSDGDAHTGAALEGAISDGSRSGSTSMVGTGSAGSGTPASAPVAQQQPPQLQPQVERKPMMTTTQLPQQQQQQQHGSAPVNSLAASRTSSGVSSVGAPYGNNPIVNSNQTSFIPAVSTTSVPATAPTQAFAPMTATAPVPLTATAPSAAGGTVPQPPLPSAPVPTLTSTAMPTTAPISMPTTNPIASPAQTPMPTSNQDQGRFSAPVSTTSSASAAAQVQFQATASTPQQQGRS